MKITNAQDKVHVTLQRDDRQPSASDLETYVVISSTLKKVDSQKSV